MKTKYPWYPYKYQGASMWTQSVEQGCSVLLTKVLKSLQIRSILIGWETEWGHVRAVGDTERHLVFIIWLKIINPRVQMGKMTCPRLQRAVAKPELAPRSLGSQCRHLSITPQHLVKSTGRKWNPKASPDALWIRYYKWSRQISKSPYWTHDSVHSFSALSSSH